VRYDAYVEVELVEEDEAPSLRDAPDRRRPPSWPLRRWAGAATVLAVVVAGAVTVQGSDVAADARRRQDVAGLTVSLTVPLVERWNVADAAYLIGAWDDVVLLPGADASGVRAVRLADGAPVWESGADRQESCWLDGPTGPDPTEASAADVVLCQPASVGLDVPTQPRSPTRLRALDPTTGAELDVLEMPGSVILSSSVEGDVLLGGMDAAGTVTVARWSPRDGIIRWRTVVEDLTILLAADGSFLGGAWLDAPGVVVEGDRTVVLDLGTGVEVDRALGASSGRTVSTMIPARTLPDGSTVEVVTEGTGSVRTVVREPDGQERFSIDGWFVMTQVDDGSLPQVLLAERAGDGALVGLDLRDGSLLWEGDSPLWMTLRLDGIGVAVAETGWLGLDLASGAELWRVDTAAQSWGTVVSDGTSTARIELVEGVVQLVASDLRTGAERWSIPLPGDSGSFLEVLDDGSVVVAGAQGGIAVLGAP